MSPINWLAVVAAAISTFVLGGLWYSPVLFGRAWMKENDLDEASLAKSNMAKIFGLAFVFALLISANLAAFLAEPKTTASWGATAGFLAGFGWSRSLSRRSRYSTAALRNMCSSTAATGLSRSC